MQPTELKMCFWLFAGAYADWQGEDDALKTYCPNTPFYMAFVTLIIIWILMPLICCCNCCHMCYKMKQQSEVETIA